MELAFDTSKLAIFDADSGVNLTIPPAGVSREEPTAATSVSREELTAARSVSREEPTAATSVSREEPNAPSAE